MIWSSLCIWGWIPPRWWILPSSACQGVCDVHLSYYWWYSPWPLGLGDVGQDSPYWTYCFPFGINKYVDLERFFEIVKIFFLKFAHSFCLHCWILIEFLLRGSNGDFPFSSAFLHLLTEISLGESYFFSLIYLFIQLFSQQYELKIFILLFRLSSSFVAQIVSSGSSSALPPSIVCCPPFHLSLSLFSGPWRRKWQSTPVFWPGEFHRLYSPWGCKELDTMEQLSPLLTFWHCSHEINNFSISPGFYYCKIELRSHDLGTRHTHCSCSVIASKSFPQTEQEVHISY